MSTTGGARIESAIHRARLDGIMRRVNSGSARSAGGKRGRNGNANRLSVKGESDLSRNGIGKSMSV